MEFGALLGAESTIMWISSQSEALLLRMASAIHFSPPAFGAHPILPSQFVSCCWLFGSLSKQPFSSVARHWCPPRCSYYIYFGGGVHFFVVVMGGSTLLTLRRNTAALHLTRGYSSRTRTSQPVLPCQATTRAHLLRITLLWHETEDTRTHIHVAAPCFS